MPRTYVYVSNATDGEIGSYRMQADGALQPGARFRAGDAVGPMAVSPDRRFLYAALRSQPFSVHAYAIDRDSGALQSLSVSPLAASFPYISLDKTGRYLFGASYQSHLVSVNAVGADGRVAAAPLQVITVGCNAHSIRADASNRYVYVPTLGSDQVFQLVFDAKTGRLASNTPAVAQMQPGTGPRHFVTSADNRYLYLLSELLATVTTLRSTPGPGCSAKSARHRDCRPNQACARRAAAGPGPTHRSASASATSGPRTSTSGPTANSSISPSAPAARLRHSA